MTDMVLDAGEQELFALMSEVVADVLAAGSAELRTERVEPGFALIELVPVRADACPVAISDAHGWVDISPGPEGQETTFELWAETRAESLELTRRCVRAVIDGRYEVSLERSRRLLGFIGPWFWWFVGDFHTATGTKSYRRGPADLEERRPLFGATPAANAKRLGPHRYPPYA